jgi:magnesium-transporting ATPase (P-type)
MDDDKKIKEENDSFKKKVLKTILYTVYIVFLSWGISCMLGFVSGSSEISVVINVIIGVFISLIFTVLYCTFTIIEEIRKTK